MKRKVIATLLWMAFVCCCTMGVLSVINMGRTWGERATCSVDALTVRDLSLLTALYPDLPWTAYAQSAPEQITNDDVPGRAANAAVLSFLGAPDRIAFFPLVSGRLPMDGERGACALDVGTAFRLYGSTAPGEVYVRLSDETMRVVGVMDVPRPLVLLPAAQDAMFEKLVADDRDALLTLASSLEVAPDPFELSGAERSKLPWSIPARLLPSRWSDFTFYGEQMATFKARPYRAPDLRDELLKSDTLRVWLWYVAALGLLWMERKWLRCGKSR